jgi:23S rRNA pseudouridine1911/1915/1917 synthase
MDEQGPGSDLTWVVSDDEANLRLDQFLGIKFPELSRTHLLKTIKIEDVLIDGRLAKKFAEKLSAESSVILQGSRKIEGENNLKSLNPRHLPLEIIFEDDDVLVLAKRPGVVVHPGAGTVDTTLVEGVLHHMGLHDFGQVCEHFKGITAEGEIVRPGVVHRLDKDTSGVMVFAKNTKSHRHLAQQFAEKTNLRRYVALLVGMMPDRERYIETWHQRDPIDRKKFLVTEIKTSEETLKKGVGSSKKRRASTTLRRIGSYAGCYDLVEAELYTGRTHQIRLHTAFMGCPIVGDPIYGKSVQFSARTGLPEHLLQPKPPFLLLHARSLGFDHPISGEKMLFESDIPEYFHDFLKELKPFLD